MSYETSSAPALVLGARITALGVIRTLGRAGIPNYLAGMRDFTNWSRWHHPLPREVRCLPEHGGLLEWLESIPLSRAVLLPCDDDLALEVANLPPALVARFPASISQASTIASLVDKGRFAEVLTRYDVPHPPTVIVNSPQELGIFETVDLTRFFMKPRNSLRFSCRYGVKALWFTEPNRAVQVARDALSQGIPFMLQEYIPGPAAQHYFIDGFVDRNGTVLAEFARQRIRMYPSDFGNSSFHVSVPIETVRPAAEGLRRLLRSLDYRGIFSAEFKRDPRDGQFKILEVNARPWWYIEFAARSGVDVCRLAYRDALGLPCDPVGDYEVGRRCATLELDLKAYLRLRRRGEMGFWRWLRSWSGADRPVFSWSDPGPAAKMLLDILLRRPLSKRADRGSAFTQSSFAGTFDLPIAGDHEVNREPEVCHSIPERN